MMNWNRISSLRGGLLYAAGGLMAAVGMLAVGCSQPTPQTPHNLAEYSQMRSSNTNPYPRKVIELKNLQRVLDSDLPSRQRTESLKLLLHMGSKDPSASSRLSVVLTEPENSADPYQHQLKQTVLSFLLEQDYPDLAGYVVPALAQADQDPALRDAILQWLMRNPSPGVLAEIVKLWADEPSPTSLNEPRYRHIVERITGRTWDEALLAGINSRQSFVRGRALEILTARIPAATLAERIMAIHPEAEPMAALQSFLETFGYLPLTRTDFASVASLFKTRIEMMRDVARLDSQWADDYGYRFKIYDFHLLSRLARDPLRGMLRRTQLILEISAALAKRQHVRVRTQTDTPMGFYTDRFEAQISSLTITDLWNLYLLNEMLSRPRMQLALRIMADRIQADPGSATHGLIFYRNGQGEAMLYPPPDSPGQAEGSGAQPVSPRMSREGRDSLCRFYTHFRKAQNVDQAGANIDELRAAKAGGYYGLILTSINEYAFCAHYYNPDGRVVSLGKFPFPR